LRRVTPGTMFGVQRAPAGARRIARSEYSRAAVAAQSPRPRPGVRPLTRTSPPAMILVGPSGRLTGRSVQQILRSLRRFSASVARRHTGRKGGRGSAGRPLAARPSRRDQFIAGVRHKCDWKHRSLVLRPNPDVADTHRLAREPLKRAGMSPRSGRQSGSPRSRPAGWERFAAVGTSPRSGRQKSGGAFCRPLRGLVLPSFATHSLRCGLPNCRPLRGLKGRRFH